MIYRPCVDLSEAPASEIAEIIDKCPSGALKYELK
ncbi:MAG: (4Fe-4S)-binding protein [Methanobrevibacter sp.]|nr:(4Fe-4S)-binding protein [Methanobrevibacter sp.]